MPSMGEVIKKYRLQAKYTQTMLAKELGVTNITVFNWEKGKSDPGFKQLKWLVEKFDIPLYELFGMRSKDAYYKEMDAMFTPYQALTPENKILACRLVQQLLEHQMALRPIQLKEEAVLIGSSDFVAVAGANIPINDSRLYGDPVFVKSTPENKDADLIMRVSGDGMEPNFYDGNRVYVKLIGYAPAPDTVVITVGDNECYIKRLGPDWKLHSDNTNRRVKDRSEDSRIIGIVLGIVKDSDFYNTEDNKLLAEAFSEEIKEYKDKHQIWE